MSDFIDIIERNSKAIELLGRSYSQLRALGVDTFSIDEIPKACAQLAKQIELQAAAECAVRNP